MIFTEIEKNRKNRDQVSNLLSLSYKIVKWLCPMGTCMWIIGAQKNNGLREKLIYMYMEINTMRMDEITEGEQSFYTIKLLFEI